ncbi:PREDICTED: uncharacterized protein LOC104757323 isoform X1 [Camelina sativa]|uniref:Uncharacterized protein LOC104757323 isoform X1 n=1 Tax=Camelina sativa TaxID=90675 RepID=A0ABM0WZD9_CAMSA|nr:PREDICTED: uncharacterized protein LOC104757323 isoform X1 [Camelina sativa]
MTGQLFFYNKLQLLFPFFLSCNKANKLSSMDSSQGSSAATSTLQKIVIPNSNNEKLVGLLHDTGSTEIVVLCHGCLSNKNDPIIKYVAAAIEKEGISAFRFDFSGNGESEGSFYFGNYNYEADDLRSVIQYFTNMNRVVPIILGHSKGGNVVLVYASKYHDISSVINLTGYSDMKKDLVRRLGENYLERIKQQGFIDAREGTAVLLWLITFTVLSQISYLVLSLSMRWSVVTEWRNIKVIDYRVTKESLMERLNTNMHEICLKIDKECRVLTVYGSADEVIPLEDAKAFEKIIPNHKLEIVEGADHCYHEHLSQLATTVMEFIKTVIVNN